MAMLKDTLSYLKKSFWILALVAIVPSFLISFFAKPFSNVTFLSALFVGKTDYNFSEIFMMMFTPINNAPFWGGLIGNILFFVFLWIACVWGVCITEKHLRTGELSPIIGKHQIFSYILPVLYALLIWALIYLVETAAQSGLISLIHYICGVTPPNAIDCILSVLVALIGFVALLYCSVHLIYLPLIMVHYGYGLKESFVESLRLISKDFKSVLWGFVTPIVAVIFLNTLLSLIAVLIKEFAGASEGVRYWLDYFVSVVTHTVIIAFLIAYATVTFYKLSDLERRDIKDYERR